MSFRQLPGPASPTGMPRTQIRSNPGRTMGLFLCFVAIFVFILWYRRAASTDGNAVHREASNSRRLESQSRPVSVSPADAEDFDRHLQAAAGRQVEAAREIRRARECIERVLPAVEAHYMVLEKRRLQVATRAADAAQRSAEQARAELEIARNLLIERSISK